MRLKPEELDALHECLTWLRQPGNNPLNFYGAELEEFHKSCKVLMDKIKHVLPEGSTRARIRATTRLSRQMHEGNLGHTMGDEARGFVVVDLDGHPQTVLGQTFSGPGLTSDFALSLLCSLPRAVSMNTCSFSATLWRKR